MLNKEKTVEEQNKTSEISGNFFFKRLKNIKKYLLKIILSLIVLSFIIVPLTSFLKQQYENQKEIERQRILADKKQEEERILAQYPAPEIEILSSTDHQSTIKEYIFEFKAKNTNHVLVNGKEIFPKEEKYSTVIPLITPETLISVKLSNEHKSKEEKITISRDKNIEEITYEKKKNQIEDLKTLPEKYINITNSNWYTGGFGNVAIHSFTIKNESLLDCANIELLIIYLSNSGVILDSKNYTIFDKIPPGQTKTFKEINMGFIDQQVTSAKVRIEKVDIVN